jgi:hypothetical protein
VVAAALGYSDGSEGDKEQFLAQKAGERFEQALAISPTCADEVIIDAVNAANLDPSLMRLLDISRTHNHPSLFASISTPLYSSSSSQSTLLVSPKDWRHTFSAVVSSYVNSPSAHKSGCQNMPYAFSN